MSKPSPRKKFRARKLVAALLGGGLSVLLAAQFLALLKPAAAREIRAACTGLRPAVTNPALGTLPTAAEEFTAQAPSGAQVSLSDYRGEVVMLNFWASWCEVCKAEKPSLEALKRELGRDGLRVIAVASDRDWDAVQDALGGALPHGTPLEVLLDPPEQGHNLGPIARAFGVGAVPETFLIDREGNVRQYFINKRTWNSSVARTCIRAFLDE
jgi:thiol-disulfide isomerase/thioredoxin